MLNRVYSSVLVITEQLNDGMAAVYRVPFGHRWVVKSVVWCETQPIPTVAGAYSIVIDAEYVGTAEGTIRMTVIQDSKLAWKRPGEWEGRITLREGDALIVGNLYEPFDSQHPVAISIHGYDLLDA